jgi:8-oxo-dGTP pyrophosphatase MutT (NUDIX family)
VTSSPAVPQLSASVILVRDGPQGLETFMVRRHVESRVAGGAYVFPGGTVRPDDFLVEDPSSKHLQDALLQRSDAPVDAAQAVAIYVTAVRELFEEAGVLLARGADGRLVEIEAQDTPQQERLASARLILQASQSSLRDVLADTHWQAAYECLVPFSHWVTPTPVPTRYDTRFFMAEMPQGQEALHCTIETTEGVWLRPRQVLEDRLAIVFPTAEHLRRLSSLSSTAEALAFARSKPIRRVQPQVALEHGKSRVWIDADLIDAW